MSESPDWWPTAELATLQLRARLLQQTREFFSQRQVLEVETPIFTNSGSTEVHLDQFQTLADDAGQSFTLNTSPELAMKRLLAAGYGDIYQLVRVFRANEQGRRHEPEFTMLEWYRVGYDMNDLIQEVEVLLTKLLKDRITQLPCQFTYQQIFLDKLGIDPLDCGTEELSTLYQQLRGYSPPDMEDKQDYLDLMVSELIEPELEKNRITFITHYPQQQASLARISKEDPRVAERFEVFCGGLELGNGFHELNDVGEQRRRMSEENLQRQKRGKPQIQPDALFCAALGHGLPDCSGIALGFDRIVMLAANKTSIQDVKSFSTFNA